jgi:NADPH:quinone reductase-like Zn-dependent oxidoreductase
MCGLLSWLSTVRVKYKRKVVSKFGGPENLHLIDKIGEKLSTTSTWQIGDVVAALPIVGGYAQYLCVPSNQLVSVPSGVD